MESTFIRYSRVLLCNSNDHVLAVNNVIITQPCLYYAWTYPIFLASRTKTARWAKGQYRILNRVRRSFLISGHLEAESRCLGHVDIFRRLFCCCKQLIFEDNEIRFMFYQMLWTSLFWFVTQHLMLRNFQIFARENERARRCAYELIEDQSRLVFANGFVS